MASHTREDLLQMQSLPLDAKVRMTQTRIRQWYDYWDGDVYLAFSGGKDSTVLRRIIGGMGLDVPSVYCLTGQDYPEVRRFALEQKDVEVIRPAMGMAEIIEHYGYPLVSKEQAQYIAEAKTTKSDKLRAIRMGECPDRKLRGSIAKRWRYLVNAPFKISHKCCDVLKKAPFKKYEEATGFKRITGVMAYESNLRYSNWIKFGCNAFGLMRPMSTPMAFWTEQDVLKYVYENAVPIAPVYGEVVKTEHGFDTTGLKRTGCIMCGFGVQLEDRPNRFERMAKEHPKQWKYAIHKLHFDEPLKYMGIPYGEEE